MRPASVLSIVLFLTWAGKNTFQDEIKTQIQYPPFDGWYNNRAYPYWGGTDTVLARLLSPIYSDGVFVPVGHHQSESIRPSAREISRSLMDGESGLPSVNNKTVFFAFYGQLILHEIVDVNRMGCPPEHFYIDIPPGDHFDPENLGDAKIPFQRCRYDQVISGYYSSHPREQLNQVTPYMDGGTTYGNLRTWSNLLRVLKDDCPGRTATSHIFANENNSTDCRGELSSYKDEGLYPLQNNIGLPLRNPCDPRDHLTRPVERFYRIADRLGNEIPFLLSLNLLWFRHHNWIARELRKEGHDDWDDLKLFNEARIRNIGTFQKIAMYDWLPILLGNCTDTIGEPCEQLPPYKGYDPIVNSQVSNLFQAAAKIYLYTLYPPGVFIRSQYNRTSGECEFYKMTNATAGPKEESQKKHEGKPALRLCNAYWNSMEALNEYGIDQIIMGMASQIAEKEDHIITEDLQKYFHGPRHFSRSDAMAMAIQSGRDHGLTDYQTSRFYFGYPKLENFSQINPELFGREDIGAETTMGQ